MTVQAPSQGNDLGSDTVVWTFKKEEARRLLIPGDKWALSWAQACKSGAC